MAERRRTLRGSIAGEDVRFAQAALKAARFDPGREDGIFGTRTASAVRKFQQANALAADGILGPGTWERLSDVTGLSADEHNWYSHVLHSASVGPDVESAQERLSELGFFPGRVDGVFGPDMEGAVLGFQGARGLPLTGVVDDATWEALDADAPPPPEGGGPAGRRVFLACAEADKDDEGVQFMAGLLRRHIDVVWTVEAEPMPTVAPGDVIVMLVTEAMLGAPASITKVLFGWARASGRLIPVMLQDLPPDLPPFAEFDPVVAQDKEPADAVAAILDRLGIEAPRSWFPGYAADSIAGEDLLGIRKRVDFLSSVLASKRLETPLAVGIFGDWGSGKSFFMHHLQNSIDRLVEESADAEHQGDETYYCAHVRQVTFNAWLYSDSDMWPNLAAQIFRSVSGAETEAPHGDTQTRALGQFQDHATARFRQLVEHRHAVEVGEATLDRRIEEITGEIAAKRAQVAEQADRVGPETSAVARAAAAAQEAGAGIGRIRRAWRVTGRWERVTVAAVAATGIAVAAITAIDREWFATVTAALLPVIAVVVAVARYVNSAARAQLVIADLEERVAGLNAERARLAAERSAAERTEQEFRARPVLPAFAAEQAQRWTARAAQSGTITEIRSQFEQLSNLIDENLRARALGEDPPADVPPIERVIVYIDDLDRCQPSVVVSVLEAMKLLLALPHFVVIVGVDSRWLFRSLEVNFEQMLGGEDGRGATPQNYLEKIFQYSLVLPPMSAEGFDRLVRRMLPVEAGVPPPPLPTEPAPAAAEPAPQAPPGHGAHALPGPLPPAKPERDLTPSDLVISRAELTFILRLAPMFETPRATKRMTNLYRLIRVAVGADRLLVGDAYQPMLVLLAVSLAHPAEAGFLFRTLAGAEVTLGEMLASGFGEPEWLAVRPDLAAVVDGSPLADRPATEFAAWASVVAEFSFHPWRELLHEVEP